MSTRLGKTIAHRTYLHASALEQLDATTRERIHSAEQLAEVSLGVQCNVVKLDASGHIISLLSYPGFFEEAFPSLRASWTVDLDQRSVRYRTYANSLNPPILHRKELLLSDSHPDYGELEALTAAAEQIGLFDDTVRIGFRQAWEDLLQQRGYRISGHQLVPIANDESEAVALTEHAPPLSHRESWHGFPNTVARHLTALQRYGFSAPVQTLARFGFLDGTKRVFDYGCGRGDDLRGLRENGIEANGWDPHFAPHELKRSAALVNLGFVINVIENIEERIEAVQAAYALTDELLVVSAMLANHDAVRGQPYGDGILTSRRTFQKYYSQGELGQFVAEVLDEDPLPVAPGIYYVFKDKDAEQRFRMRRQENRRNILRLSLLSRPQKRFRIDRGKLKYEQNRDSLESLWDCCLLLGREPDQDEIANIDEILANFGSARAALRFITSRKECAQDMLEAARDSRIDDLRVYFAQLQFERRKPYRHLESRLQRDVRLFFGDYREAIAQASQQAAEQGIGWLEEGRSLQLHGSLVPQLPPILRAYVNCGLQLYGDASNSDLSKTHIHSAKLTLMSFDEFVGKPLPRMLQRIKVRLRHLDFDLFEHARDCLPTQCYPKTPTFNETFPNFA